MPRILALTCPAGHARIPANRAHRKDGTSRCRLCYQASQQARRQRRQAQRQQAQQAQLERKQQQQAVEASPAPPGPQAPKSMPAAWPEIASGVWRDGRLDEHVLRLWIKQSRHVVALAQVIHRHGWQLIDVKKGTFGWYALVMIP